MNIPAAFRPLILLWHLWLEAHAAMIFSSSRRAGALCLLATLVYPRITLGGFLGLLIAQLWIHALQLPDVARPSIRLNALLSGLALSALWLPLSPLDLLICLLILSLSVFITLALDEAFWRSANLPTLSLPFTLSVWLAALFLGGMTPAIPEFAYFLETEHPVGRFLATLGTIFLSPHPLSGLCVLAALLMSSRWLCILAISGYGVGYAALQLIAPQFFSPFYAFSFPLIAMALGGVFCFPNKAAFMLGMFGVLFGVLSTLAFEGFFQETLTPSLSAPFVLASLLVLVTIRHARRGVIPLLSHPALPEYHAESARLARYRLGPAESYPLPLPVMGAWQIYQGMDGPHTHQGLGRYALDFFLAEAGKSFREHGTRLEDYRCYGAPVISPLDGKVVVAIDTIPDNPLGQLGERVEQGQHWGNHVVIQTATGLFVWLAHLRQGSLAVKQEDIVRPGDLIGHCGNSGRSPQPHLHMHLQATPFMGAPSLPFHLDNVIVQPKNAATPQWQLAYRPKVGDTVSPAIADRTLAQALALPIGRTLGFEVAENGGPACPWELRVEVMFSGQIRLVNNNASIAAINGPHAFALYDRQGGANRCLDIFALALGLTPFSETHAWEDAPSAQLFPLSWAKRIFLSLTRPLGHALQSRYQRTRTEQGWTQVGEHTLTLFPGWENTCRTEIQLGRGGHLTRITAYSGTRELIMSPVSVGQQADEGIPGWETTLDKHTER